MLRTAAIVVLAAASASASLAACSGDDGDGSGGAAAEELADRVVAVLEADGQAVDGDLDGAEVVCPPVQDPEPGDRATCDVRLDGGSQVEVDVEFEDDGAITVVGVIPG